MVRPTLMLVGAPRHRVAGPARLEGEDLLQIELHHVGKLEVLEEQVEDFLARQHEAKIVFGLAAASLPSLAATALARLRDAVARRELPCCRAGRGRAGRCRSAFWKLGSLVPFDRHRDGVFGVHVGDLAGPDLIPDGPLQFLARPPQEALAVAEALVLRVEPAIDEVRHGRPFICSGSLQPALFTRMYQSTSRRTCRFV